MSATFATSPASTRFGYTSGSPSPTRTAQINASPLRASSKDRGLEQPLLIDAPGGPPLPVAREVSPAVGPVKGTWLEEQVKALLYGVINMVVVTPVMSA